jgi:signal transduction histidine kinase
MLWYSGFDLRKPHPHRFWLGVVFALLIGVILLLALTNPLPTYDFVTGRALARASPVGGAPVLIAAYLAYSLLAFLLPIDLLRRREPPVQPLDVVTRRRAKPWLMAASTSLLLAGGIMAWTALWVLSASPRPSLSHPDVALAVKRFDLAVATLIAVAITLLGRAIVGYAVFTGRPLPRRGFFRQWRSTVLLAAGLGLISGGALAVQLRPLYALMSAGAAVVVFHAFFNWRAFAERAQFMAQLRPFVASLDLYDQLIDSSPPDPAAPQAIFETLCRDVLGAQSGALVPTDSLVALTGPPLLYPPRGAPLTVPQAADLSARFPSPETRCLPATEAGAAWAVSLWNERGLAGALLLGEKANGSPYTEEEIEVAQAGGERLLDTLGAMEIARVAMDLLRERVAQVKIMQEHGRRVLHDEVLPLLHTAILRLNSVQDGPVVSRAVEALINAHRHISELMRDTPSAASHRLAESGLLPALREFVEQELPGAFQRVDWQIAAETAETVGRVPVFVGEVILFAAQELVRNAARHGPGRDATRALVLTVRLEGEAGLRLEIEDDGVGFAPETVVGSDCERKEPAAGSGSGLRFHSAMLAAVGARLDVQALPGGGTRATITLPAETPSESPRGKPRGS